MTSRTCKDYWKSKKIKLFDVLESCKKSLNTVSVLLFQKPLMLLYSQRMTSQESKLCISTGIYIFSQFIAKEIAKITAKNKLV